MDFINQFTERLQRGVKSYFSGIGSVVGIVGEIVITLRQCRSLLLLFIEDE